MDSSSVSQIHVVRLLRMCMDLVLFLMLYAAQTIKPAVPHSTLVCQEEGVNRYVLSFIVSAINLNVFSSVYEFFLIQ
jgi:hypothetical protein